jgi:predicted RNase H-like HicB family nuclease
VVVLYPETWVIMETPFRRGGLTNMISVSICIWSQEDQAFIAEVLELAGCVADGGTYQEALQNVEIIMQEWIETAQALGRQIPEPTQHLMSA